MHPTQNAQEVVNVDGSNNSYGSYQLPVPVPISNRKMVIAYYRVSTEKQGRSGLGLEAQQQAVAHYCASNGYQILQEIHEVKSTRKRRVLLEKAFELCNEHKATLIVARLDRLGRDVEEIAHNIKLPVEIIVADNPHANRFTIHILAAVAEEQRRTISVNTKAALQAAKKRGIILGQNGKRLAQKSKQEAYEFAKLLEPLIVTMCKMEKICSIRKIATELNRLRIPTFTSTGVWHKNTVHILLIRLRPVKEGV